ncbi:MAG: 7-carboxy-7-deazaguanine synthase QueE [Proteobacteria bacterium]|nr:7-carboxy-7-deazaguanine synthase QueE [Pseudomonadota bacterium]
MITYSEIFHSIQGEGHYTGRPTAWLRYFLCNLQCNGFGQSDPTNPSTYKLPYEDINVDDYKSMDELPVFEFGCDSSYSWAKKFKKLAYQNTAEEIANNIRFNIKSDQNECGAFNFNDTKTHMCFTGGEPLMKHAQKATPEIMQVFFDQNDWPRYITFETNGTQALTEDFKDSLDDWRYEGGIETFFSVSPKLWTVAGEKASKAIKPDVVAEYAEFGPGQLKFVCNGRPEAWDEIEEVTKQFRSAGVDYPVWIMPVGATVEGQKLCDGDVAREAFKRGYNVSARVHTYLWGNIIGV